MGKRVGPDAGTPLVLRRRSPTSSRGRRLGPDTAGDHRSVPARILTRAEAGRQVAREGLGPQMSGAGGRWTRAPSATSPEALSADSGRGVAPGPPPGSPPRTTPRESVARPVDTGPGSPPASQRPASLLPPRDHRSARHAHSLYRPEVVEPTPHPSRRPPPPPRQRARHPAAGMQKRDGRRQDPAACGGDPGYGLSL